MRDSSTDRVFYGQVEHIPVEEPNEEDQAEGQVIVEFVDSLSEGIETETTNAKMVVRRKMTTDQFLPGGQPTQHQAPRL